MLSQSKKSCQLPSRPFSDFGPKAICPPLAVFSSAESAFVELVLITDLLCSVFILCALVDLVVTKDQQIMAATNLPYHGSKNAVIDVIFNKYCADKVQGLTAIELQELYQSVRPDGLNIKQIEASLRTVCELEQCDEEDLVDVLREMDRRYFLVNDLKWEFVMLDREQKGAITQQDAKFLFKMVHGEFFSQRRWNKFLNARAAKESLISFSEIEVDLCEIPTVGWIEEVLEEEEEERRGCFQFVFIEPCLCECIWESHHAICCIYSYDSYYSSITNPNNRLEQLIALAEAVCSPYLGRQGGKCSDKAF